MADKRVWQLLRRVVDRDRGSVSIIAWLLVLCLVLMPIGQGGAMNLQEERMIGEKLLYSIRSNFRLLDDPDISQYINRLGQSVLAVAGPQFFDYHFFVVKNDEFNAFAAPGGLVFFFTGLIRTMKSENELVSVLAHEIGHVVSRHIARRIDKSGKINALTMGLGLAGMALGHPEVLVGSMAAGQALNLHYSRQDEEEADRLSFGWMQALHRDPSAMESMLKTMRRIARYRSGRLPQYLLTHPNPEARLDYVQSLLEVQRQQAPQVQYTSNDDFAFLRFKYRVLAQSMEPGRLRLYCQRQQQSAKDRLHKGMALFGLAQAALAEHDYPQAEQAITRVRELLPSHEILAVDQAWVLMMAGKLDEAAVLFAHGLKRDPSDMYATFGLARLLIREKKYDRADVLLAKVAKVMPEYSRIYYEQARIRSAQGREAESRFFLGKYWLYQGRLKQAKGYLRQSAADPKLKLKLRQEARAILDRLKELEEL